MCYRGKLLNTHWSHKGWSAPASETQFIWWSMTHGGDGDINSNGDNGQDWQNSVTLLLVVVMKPLIRMMGWSIIDGG